MPIQLSNHRIKSRSENRIPRTQLLTHTQPLRTLTGKHENRLAPRHRHTTSHPNTRTALNHLSQPRQQLITARTDHHRRPLLKLFDDRKSQFCERNIGVRNLKRAAGQQLSALQHQDGLYQAGDSGCAFQMPDIGLDASVRST